MQRARRSIAKVNLVFPNELMKLGDIPESAHEDVAQGFVRLLKAGRDTPAALEALAAVLAPYDAGKWTIVSLLPFRRARQQSHWHRLGDRWLKPRDFIHVQTFRWVASGMKRDARDERDIRAMKSLRLEKLKGDRDGQYSLRLNDRWRLILLILDTEPKHTIQVVEIDDYH